jgi:hypothetical protein
MIDFTNPAPLPTAVENISSRTPIGCALSSEEWSIVPAELRMRAMFSARVEEVRYLVSMQDKIEQRVRLARESGVTMDRSRFIAEMQEDLRAFGYEPDPRKRGSMQDLSSAGRLGLIYEMNLAMAEGYSAWKMGMDKDILDAAPARELIRLANRKDKRPWPAIWSANGGNFYGEPTADFPDAPGRMIALATDDIWVRISEFGTPWPPFRWGSGVGTRNVRRREAEKLGLLDAKTKVKPLDTPFNESARASLKDIPEPRRQVLAEEFQGEVEIEGDEIRLLPIQKFADSGGSGKRPKKKNYSDKDQPGPRGRVSIAEKITVEREIFGKVADQAKAAIEQAAQVHKIPDITPVKLRTKVIYTGAGGRFLPGKEPVILLNPYTLSVDYTVFHELGHVVDHLALQGLGERLFASEGQPNPKVQRVMNAIAHSSAYHRLRNENPQGYWLEPAEFFARAYAQYIAQKAQNSNALDFIRKVKNGDLVNLGWPQHAQWSQADFRVIVEAFSELLLPI